MTVLLAALLSLTLLPSIIAQNMSAINGGYMSNNSSNRSMGNRMMSNNTNGIIEGNVNTTVYANVSRLEDLPYLVVRNNTNTQIVINVMPSQFQSTNPPPNDGSPVINIPNMPGVPVELQSTMQSMLNEYMKLVFGGGSGGEQPYTPMPVTPSPGNGSNPDGKFMFNATHCGTPSGMLEFSCYDTAIHCIPTSWRCDGENDCMDGRDELGCSASTQVDGCEAGYVKCENMSTNMTNNAYNGGCIPSSWMCDQMDDCGNNWDEANCSSTPPPPIQCQWGYIPCSNSTGEQKCIDPRWVCDGFADCATGSDEMDCALSMTTEAPFTCRYGQIPCDNSTGQMKCIPPGFVCDGENDCLTGSDEMNCDEANGNATYGNGSEWHGGPRGNWTNGGWNETTEPWRPMPPHMNMTTGQNCTNGTGPDCRPAGQPYNCTGQQCLMEAQKRMKEALPWTFSSSPSWPNCTINENTTGVKCGDMCIEMIQLCDGVPDCDDGRDESMCQVEKVKELINSKISMMSEHMTRRQSDVGQLKIVEQSIDWNTRVCDKGEGVRCPMNNECISKHKLCDGFKDCPAGEDEKKSWCDNFTG